MALALDYQADQDGFSKQYDADQVAKQAQDAQQKQPPSFLQQWTSAAGRATSGMLDSAVSAADAMYDSAPMRKARDVVAGGITGATNIADAVHSFGKAAIANAGRTNSDRIGDAVDPANAAREANYDAVPTSPMWDHAKASILDFRDAVAVKDPTLSDNLTQGVAQLALPFAGFSRALAGVHGLANMALAGGITDATALGPHDMRMADLIALGRHTEGKLGDALRALAPDGSAVNAYINYLTDRGNESEAGGRWKNVLDGFGANLIATPLLHTVGMVLKQGMGGLRYLADNGVGSSGGIAPRSAQVGAVGDLSARPPLRQGADPAESLYDDQVRRDVAAAAANPNGKRPPLVQGNDPAAAIYDDRVRQDVDNGAPRTPAAPPATALDTIPAVTSFRKVLQSQAGAIDPTGTSGAQTSHLARMLSSHLPDDGAEGSFYKDVLSRVADANLEGSKVQVSAADHPDGRLGSYMPATGAVSLYPGASVSNTQLVHTFAHEAVHAATMDALAKTPAIYNSLNQLLTSAGMDRGVQALGKIDKYGLTNPKEFVAEAESNPRFRAALQQVKAHGTDGGSLWDEYKKVIAGVLGVGGTVAASPLFDKLLTKEKKGA